MSYMHLDSDHVAIAHLNREPSHRIRLSAGPHDNRNPRHNLQIDVGVEIWNQAAVGLEAIAKADPQPGFD